MRDLFGDGIFAVDGDRWRHQRKLASYESSTKILRDFSSSVFRTNTAKLTWKIYFSSADKQVIDFQDLFMKSTLDSIFKVGFGVEHDTLSGIDEFSNQFMKALDGSNFITFWRFFDLLWKRKRFLNIGLEATLKKNIQIIDKFVYDVIERKREQMKNEKLEGAKEDILSRFLVESEKDPENMTEIFERYNSELYYCGEGHSEITKDDFGSRLSEPALDKMQYLHAALTETLRLYPAVPLDGKCAEEDDILPNGFKMKKGDGITYMTYAMGRMICLWGDDAEEYGPENGIFQAQSPFKFTTFQAGPRICLGKEFAYRQMKIMASFLLFFFRFKLADESYEATYRTMFTLHMDKGLPLFASSRF